MSTTQLPSADYLRLQQVTGFAAEATQAMSTKGSQLYLKNTHLSDSSNFPAVMLHTMARNPWRPAPFMPIAGKDMSCYFGVPAYRTPRDYDANLTPVTVEADAVAGDLQNRNDDLIYSGDVVITQADKTVNTQKAHYNGKKQSFVLTGQNTTVHGPEYTVKSDDPMHTDLNSSITALTNTRFQYNGSRLRGTAESHVIDDSQKKQAQEIKGAMITTCPVDDESWSLTATTVEFDKDSAFGEAWNPVLWLGKVPVFYSPYLNFPIKNERRTGLLYPTIGWGSDGFGMSQPIYLNLAPNYDATVTPEWTGEHHWIVYNQFRFMPFENLRGTLRYDHVFEDADWEDSPFPEGDRRRWFMSVNATANYLQGDLKFTLNYSRVRTHDHDYLRDIGQEGVAVTEDHLVQSLKANYDQPKYSFSAEARDYQSMLVDSATRLAPLAMMPNLEGNYHETMGRGIFNLDGSITRFTRDSKHNFRGRDADSFGATRIHLEPSFKYHLVDYAGTTLDAGARIFATHYSQDDLDEIYGSTSVARSYYGVDHVDTSVNRFLYELELRGKTTFERPVIDMRHIQTIEPEFKYQFIPYKDQNNIALYDTSNRTDDYYSLYSWRRYTGIDRIADINMLTVGLTTRLLDSHDRELLKISAAQGYNFDPTDVTLYSYESPTNETRSPLSASLDASPIDSIRMHGQVTYNTTESQLSTWNASLGYQENGYLARVSYRYGRDMNIDYYNGQTRDVRQFGLELMLPFADRWQLTGAYYRDMEQFFNINRKIALSYDECCWSIAFIFEDYMKLKRHVATGYEMTKNRKVGVEFTLKGFLGIGARNIAGANTTATHFLPAFDPTNLNR